MIPNSTCCNIFTHTYTYIDLYIPGRDCLVVSMSASHAVGRGLAPRLGHNKDYNKNGTHCIFAWHAVVRIGI